MSRLTSSMARQLVGRLHVGEGVLELALPRGVRPEGVPRRGHPRRVQPDQLGRDLADRLARPALGLGPVRPAEAVQRRRLAADVPGDLLQLVGRHVQPVRRVAALAGGVLEHQVLAGGPGSGPARHLQEPADAVLLVHDVVARLELQRVDPAAPPGRHPPLVLAGDPAGAARHQVALGEQRQLERRPGEALAAAHRWRHTARQPRASARCRPAARRAPRRAASPPAAGPARAPR